MDEIVNTHYAAGGSGRGNVSVCRGGSTKEVFFKSRVAAAVKRLGTPDELNSDEFEEYRYEKNTNKITFFKILDSAMSDLGYLRISNNIYRKL